MRRNLDLKSFSQVFFECKLLQYVEQALDKFCRDLMPYNSVLAYRFTINTQKDEPRLAAVHHNYPFLFFDSAAATNADAISTLNKEAAREQKSPCRLY